MVTGFIPSGYTLAEHIDMIEAINHIDAHRFIHRTTVLMTAVRAASYPSRVVIFLFPGRVRTRDWQSSLRSRLLTA